MDNIQLTLESSTTSLSLNSDSIYLNPEIDGLAGLPEIRTTSGVNAGYNGGWTSAQFYDARLITIRGVISNSDVSVVEDRRKALVGLLGQGRKEELTLHFVTAGGNSYVLNCRTISCEMALSGLARKQEFLIQLRADDPLIYDDGALATEAIVNVRRALGGFQIDFGLPLYIGGGVNETLVENGNETVYPVINLYGPLHSPTIINQTTNQQMQVLTDLDYTLTWVNPVEVTGDYILVTNETDKESPLSSVELLGNTTQNTLSGKNLLELPNAGTSSGITYSINNNGTFNLHGTNSAGYEVLFTYYIDSTEFQSTNYTLSANKALPDGAAVRLEIYSGSTWKRSFVTVNNTRQSQTATPNFTDANRVRVAVGVSSGKTVNIDNLGVMLEKSSSVTTFEPYCGGIASPNPDYPQTVQTTTGEQVVEITGKNLFDVEAIPYVAKRAYGSDGAVLSWTGYTGTNEYQPVEPNTQYTIWNNKISNTTYLCEYDENKNFIQRLIALKTFTTTATTKYLRWSLNVGSGEIPPTQTQLELGSTASDFEPYQSQSYEVNLGKNLFDKDNVVQGIPQASDGSIGQTTGAGRTCQFIPVIPNTQYTHSGHPGGWAVIAYYRADKSFISRDADATTITTPSDCFYASVSCNAGNLSTCQFELGSTATTYAPYFTPIELCKLGDYQDKIYKSGDDWFVRKEVGKAVLDGSESEWATPNNISYSLNKSNNKISNMSLPAQTLQMFCDHFTPAKFYNAVGSVAAGSQYVNFDYDGTSSDLAGFKTWLANNNVSFYAPLATATDTQITNEDLIDQLNALASSTLFVGVNNIALVPSGGAQGELSIDYFSAYTEDRDIVVIDSQARTITKNGADIYYLKADGSEFPTLAPGENTLYLTSEQTSDEGYAEIKFKQGYLSI